MKDSTGTNSRHRMQTAGSALLNAIVSIRRIAADVTPQAAYGLPPANLQYTP